MTVAVDAAGPAEAVSPDLEDPVLARAHRRIGSVLRGKWHLDSLLGVGGMATVYAGTHRNGTRAALKLLHPELSIESQWRKRFLREGRVANAVGHDGAVKVLDDDVSEDGSVYLVLELLEGESLERRWQRLGFRLDEREVLWIADQLLDVLAAAHARGIVHRDVKPDNLFLTSSGSLKVLDFGIARLREWSTASVATRDGETMGTPAFMSPEQARGLSDEVDARSDLYSLGATMFTLISGRSLHGGRTPNEAILSAMTVPAKPISSIVPGIAYSVANVIDVALAFDKDKRWPSAERMQEAARYAYLDRTGRQISMAPRPVIPEKTSNPRLAFVGGAVSPAPTMPAPNVEGGGARRRRAAAAFGAATAVLLSVAVVLARHGNSSRSPDVPPVTQSSPAVPTLPSASPSGSSTASSTTESKVEEGPPSRSEPPVASPTSARAATSSRGASKAVSAPKLPARDGCAVPFVVDPATHIKRWKLDCL
jgi:eukaryotic-like serine/threonine-protein kinase